MRLGGASLLSGLARLSVFLHRLVPALMPLVSSLVASTVMPAIVPALAAAAAALRMLFGLCGLGGRSVEAVLVNHGQRLTRQPFDIAQQAFLGLVAERQRNAIAAGSRGAADAMHIGIGNVRDLEIDHMGDAVDIDAA